MLNAIRRGRRDLAHTSFWMRPLGRGTERRARRFPPYLCVALALAPVACRSSDRSDQATAALQHLPMPGRTDLPFSAVVRAGTMLYLSGQLGTDSTGRLVSGGVGPETDQALTNIRALLERAGSGMDRVVRCTAMLADMGEWGEMNRAYLRHFPPGRLPARSAFGTSGLALGARVEIECTAMAETG